MQHASRSSPLLQEPAISSVGVVASVASYFIDLILLLEAYLVALYLRQTLPFGKFVGVNYQWNDPRAYLTIVLALAAVHAARRPLSRFLGAGERFWTAIIGIVLAVLGLTIFVSRFSGLQKGYFALSASILVALVIPRSTTQHRRMEARPLVENLRRLWGNRSLLRIWVQYNVQSRYSQALLGVLWIVLLPLSTAFVMSVVFSQIMRVQIHNVPFIAFFLAGFVPWGLFNQSVAAGMRSILSALGLINQIYFPREIIVLSALGEALVDTGFMFGAMLLVNAIVGIFPNWLYICLPLLLIIQISLSLGVMLMVSWFSVLVRDVPQLVSVLLQIFFYLSPVIYPLSIVPHRYRFLITLNPVAVIVEAYHRIIVYDRPPDWLSLVYPAALGFALLVFGYRVFKTNEDRMADMV